MEQGTDSIGGEQLERAHSLAFTPCTDGTPAGGAKGCATLVCLRRPVHPASAERLIGGIFKLDSRVGEWAAANNVELAYTPTYSSWLNRIEAKFQALRPGPIR